MNEIQRTIKLGRGKGQEDEGYLPLKRDRAKPKTPIHPAQFVMTIGGVAGAPKVMKPSAPQGWTEHRGGNRAVGANPQGVAQRAFRSPYRVRGSQDGARIHMQRPFDPHRPSPRQTIRGAIVRGERIVSDQIVQFLADESAQHRRRGAGDDD